MALPANDDPRIAALVAQFTPEGKAGNPPIGFGDHFVFYVGRDDCHMVLRTLIAAETYALKMNMFGYDDDDLDAVILDLIKNKNVACQITLDKSQAGGVHEKKLVLNDQTVLGDEYTNSFAIGQSLTHQISHTKGGVLAGQGIGWEGSMNWSDSGEGTGIVLDPGAAQKAGFKAQNNTLMVSTNPVFLQRFGARLDIEHSIVLQQQLAAAKKLKAAQDPAADGAASS